jgi:hypothetical protein
MAWSQWRLSHGIWHTELSSLNVNTDDAPATKTNTQQSSNAAPATFSTAEMEQHFPPTFINSIHSDNDIQMLDDVAEQAKTLKQVKFFMSNTYDKHFIPIDVPTLTGSENYRYWRASMKLLFRQHGVWSVVNEEVQPLSRSHPLYLWYERMLDCAVGLIYSNVSEEIRKTPCFLSTVLHNDPDELMAHMYAHYGSSDGEEQSHEHEDERD